MLIVLELEEQENIVRLVEIEANEDETVEATAMRLATELGFELEEVLQDLSANGQALQRHHKVSHYHEHGNRWRHRHHRIRVVVYSPRSAEPKQFFWRGHMPVGEAAKLAAAAFEYVGGHPGLQTDATPPRVLDNQKTLEAEHVHCGATLELIDSGGGVCDPF